MESKMDSMGHLETQVMQWLKWDRLVSIALSLSGQHKAPNPTDSNGLILDDLILQRLNGTQLVSISLILSGTFKAPPTWAKMDSFGPHWSPPLSHYEFRPDCRVHVSFGSDTSISRGPFYWHGLTLILAWISNYMHDKVWDEII